MPQFAVTPSVTSLVKAKLLRHQDKDVGLIITCNSEITRITALEVPSNDDILRKTLQLFVESFQNLDDIRNLSFTKMLRF